MIDLLSSDDEEIASNQRNQEAPCRSIVVTPRPGSKLMGQIVQDSCITTCCEIVLSETSRLAFLELQDETVELVS